MHVMINDMDYFYKNNFSFHLSPIPRRFAAAVQLADIGYARTKRERVSYTFRSYNYSFILSGTGTYLWQGHYLPVIAPCVITQSPGVKMDYGATTSWEELYFIYNIDHIPTLTQKGFIREQVALWPIYDPTQLQLHLSELIRLLNTPYIDPYIDKIDALSELLIMESLLGEPQVYTAGDLAAIKAIEAYVNTHLHEEVDFAALAAQHHLHPATFRRRWMRAINIPPARFLMEQRIKEACRLLVETTLPIVAIATFLRFQDQLYFARKFKQFTTMTATQYRQRYRATSTLQYLPGVLPDRYRSGT